MLQSFLTRTAKWFLAIIFIITAWGLPVKATHIVGGEMVYDYMGNDSYYVQLTIYTDCYNGNPRAISSDSTGFIAVYGGLKFNLLNNLEVWRSMPIRLNKVYYNCVVPPGDVCVDKYVFDTFFVLKPNLYGYYITFQRCCRNGSILNLQDPLRTGATYFAFIPPFQEFGSNSSPHFKNRPPNYLCVNEQFVMNHSAKDMDGDSLAYRICTPYNMRNIEPSKPNLPSSPPYNTVVWKRPYNDTVPLPVKNNFRINPITGQLQFMPIKLGQYVFGVCVDEFRNGRFLSTTFRDYQFNIMPCFFNVKANFNIPNIYCGDTLKLNGLAKGAKETSWIIEKPDGSSIISKNNEENVANLKTGTYKIAFIATDGNCADTLVKKVAVLPKFTHQNLIVETCRNDTVIFQGRNFYAKKTYWANDSLLFPVNDTLRSYVASNEYVFINKGDFKGCSFIDSYSVKINTHAPEIEIDTIPHCLGNVLTLELLNVVDFETVVWSFDGKIENASFIEILVPFSNLQEVNLMVTNKSCKDSASIYYENLEKSALIFENANIITPNNDGLNDCFKPIISGGDFDCNAYSLLIFNRWGEKVFESINQNSVPCWDAKNFRNGMKVLAGVYLYFIEVDGYKSHGMLTVIY